jgi:hypothetical protein
MNLRNTIKRVLNEQLVNSAPNARRESKLLEKLLKSKSYDGLCGIRFTFDIGEDRVGGAYLMFSSEWYMSYEDSEELNKKLLHIQVVKKDFGRAAKQMLGLDNLYVGSELENPKNCSGLS